MGLQLQAVTQTTVRPTILCLAALHVLDKKIKTKQKTLAKQKKVKNVENVTKLKKR